MKAQAAAKDRSMGVPPVSSRLNGQPSSGTASSNDADGCLHSSKDTSGQDVRTPVFQFAAAYVLLEIIIALTIFAVVVTGLAGLLHSTLDGANELRRQAAMRRGLESILVEAREKPKREEMALTTRDDALGVEFRSALEEVKWINRKGQPVKGLWLLTASATDLHDGNTVRDRAEVYVYRP